MPHRLKVYCCGGVSKGLAVVLADLVLLLARTARMDGRIGVIAIEPFHMLVFVYHKTSTHASLKLTGSSPPTLSGSPPAWSSTIAWGLTRERKCSRVMVTGPNNWITTLSTRSLIKMPEAESAKILAYCFE